MKYSIILIVISLLLVACGPQLDLTTPESEEVGEVTQVSEIEQAFEDEFVEDEFVELEEII